MHSNARVPVCTCMQPSPHVHAATVSIATVHKLWGCSVFLITNVLCITSHLRGEHASDVEPMICSTNPAKFPCDGSCCALCSGNPVQKSTKGGFFQKELMH